MGDLTENPYRLDYWKVQIFQLDVNEHPYFPERGLKTDFARGDFGELYMTLLKDCGYWQNYETGPSLSYREFDNNQVLWSVHIGNKFPETQTGQAP